MLSWVFSQPKRRDLMNVLGISSPCDVFSLLRVNHKFQIFIHKTIEESPSWSRHSELRWTSQLFAKKLQKSSGYIQALSWYTRLTGHRARFASEASKIKREFKAWPWENVGVDQCTRSCGTSQERIIRKTMKSRKGPVANVNLYVVKERRLLEERKRAKQQDASSKVIFYSVLYFSILFHFPWSDSYDIIRLHRQFSDTLSKKGYLLFHVKVKICHLSPGSQRARERWM